MDKLSHKTESTVTIVIIIMYKRPTHTHTHAYISIYCTLLVLVFSIRAVYCSSIDLTKCVWKKRTITSYK